MARILHIDSSPRGERAHSGRLTKEFVAAWKTADPAGTITYRDIGRNPVSHVSETFIAAAYTAPEKCTPELQEAIRLSDVLVDEFLAADCYIIGVPMYNFSIPSTLKASIDQILRPGRTFAVEPDAAGNPYKPLVLGNKMFVITAKGCSKYAPDECNEHLNHQDPYLKTVFGFIGITDITFIHVENDELGGASLADSIARVRTKITQLVAA